MDLGQRQRNHWVSSQDNASNYRGHSSATGDARRNRDWRDQYDYQGSEGNIRGSPYPYRSRTISRSRSRSPVRDNSRARSTYRGTNPPIRYSRSPYFGRTEFRNRSRNPGRDLIRGRSSSPKANQNKYRPQPRSPYQIRNPLNHGEDDHHGNAIPQQFQQQNPNPLSQGQPYIKPEFKRKGNGNLFNPKNPDPNPNCIPVDNVKLSSSYDNPTYPKESGYTGQVELKHEEVKDEKTVIGFSQRKKRHFKDVHQKVDLQIHSLENDLTPPLSAEAELFIANDTHFSGIHNVDNREAPDRRQRFENRKLGLRIIIRHVIDDKRADHIKNEDDVYTVLESFLKDRVYTSCAAFKKRFPTEADRICLAIEAQRRIDGDIGEGTPESIMPLKWKRKILKLILSILEITIWDYTDDTKAQKAKVAGIWEVEGFEISLENMVKFFRKHDNDPLFFTEEFQVLMTNAKEIRNELSHKDNLTFADLVDAKETTLKMWSLFRELRKQDPSVTENRLSGLRELLTEWETRDQKYDFELKSRLFNFLATLPSNNTARLLFEGKVIESLNTKIWYEKKRIEYQKGATTCLFLQESYYRKEIMGKAYYRHLKEFLKGGPIREFDWDEVESRVVRLT